MSRRVSLTKHTAYYFGLFLYVLSVNIQYSYAYINWSLADSSMLSVISLMRYAAYLLCILHFFLIRRLNFYTAAAIIILIIAALYATHTGPQRAPIFYSIFLISGIQTDFKKCVKIFLSIQLTTFTLYIALSSLGVMGEGVVETNGRIRSFLGYGWVNRASYCWFFICLELLYLKNNKLNWKYSLVLAIVNYYVYYKTNTVFSMSMTYGIILFGLANYLHSKYKRKAPELKENKLNKYSRLAVIFFVSTIILGVALPLIYNSGNPIMYQLNKLTTGRLSLGKTAIERYGIHLGGNKLQWVGSSTLRFRLNNGTEYFYVDNGFLQMALEFGLLFTAFIGFIYVMSIIKSFKSADIDLAVIFIIIGILSIFEPYTVDFGFNPFPLYYFSTISIKQIGTRVNDSRVKRQLQRTSQLRSGFSR